jgi:hypothetical protein
VGNPDAMGEMLEEIPVGKIKDNTIILVRCNASRNNPQMNHLSLPVEEPWFEQS